MTPEGLQNPFGFYQLNPESLTFRGRFDKGGRKTQEHEDRGVVFHEIKENQMPERQEFTSLLLKGIARVADVVTDQNEKRYSKDMFFGMDDVDIPEGSSEELYADLLLLSTIFGDKDHSVGAFPNNVLKKGKGYYIFDFDGRHRDRVPKIDEYFCTDSLQTRLLEEFTHVPMGAHIETIKVFKEKLNLLYQTYADEVGKTIFKAILEKSKVAPPEKADALYIKFVEYLKMLIDTDEQRFVDLIT